MVVREVYQRRRMKLFRHAAWSRNPGLLDPSFAPIAWRKVRHCLRDAIAVCLLPEEIQIVSGGWDANDVYRATGSLLGKLDLAAPGVFWWEHGPSVHAITSPTELLDQVREVLVAPVVYGLAERPLAWLWSNYRDLVGATEAPWTARFGLDEALAGSGSFAERLMRVVDGDAGVEAARRMIRPDAEAMKRVGLVDALAASAAVHRSEPKAVRARGAVRDTFIALGAELGFAPEVTAKVAGVTRATVLRSAHRAASEATFLCLAEPSLRAPIQAAADELGVR